MEKAQMSAQLAYLAGLFDGEGCVQRNNTGIVNVKIDLDDTKFGALP